MILSRLTNAAEAAPATAAAPPAARAILPHFAHGDAGTTGAGRALGCLFESSPLSASVAAFAPQKAPVRLENWVNAELAVLYLSSAPCATTPGEIPRYGVSKARTPLTYGNMSVLSGVGVGGGGFEVDIEDGSMGWSDVRERIVSAATIPPME